MQAVLILGMRLKEDGKIVDRQRQTRRVVASIDDDLKESCSCIVGVLGDFLADANAFRVDMNELLDLGCQARDRAEGRTSPLST